MLRALILLAALALTAIPASAAVITSTLEGGLWSSGGTWIGGVIPGAGDDVIIAGPVEIVGSAACLSLEVQEAGTLIGGVNFLSTLDIGGSARNRGAIDGRLHLFDLHVGGDLSNDGSWKSRLVILTGSNDRSVTMGPGAVFESNLTLGGSDDILVEAPLAIKGNLDMGAGRMILQPECALTMRQGQLTGEILCGGNEVRFESWSYISNCDVDAAVLVGTVQVVNQVTFTGGLTVLDILENNPSGGGSSILVEGELVNHGWIRNNNYGLIVRLHGDLTCNGTITCSQIEMDDAAPRHIRMGPQGDLGTALFLPEFGSGTLIAETPLQISGGISLGFDGVMDLEPGSSVFLTGWGAISGGTTFANGNDIRMDGTGFVSGTFDRAVARGRLQVQGNPTFSGGFTVADTLQNREWSDEEITVLGTLVNEGLIRDYVKTLAIVARGDVENRGAMWNSRVVLSGAIQDQHVGVGGGIAVPEFVLDSDLDAAGYQWFRDGAPIGGETAAELTFAAVGPGDFGTYWCEATGGAMSRMFVIDEAAAGVTSPSQRAMTLLEQNRPNPFGSSTEIAFHLPEAGHVRLAVYDVAGREVSVLLDRAMPAGRHAVEWRGGELARGVFFYRLAADDRVLIRKAMRME